ncbi:MULTISPECIES: TetR/AcrR family transcriptional regulator [unclassified Brevibacterium]|uniref:TetR/AcrR family transcriptional regulator n=1 Tax=unclassified Brevibacterium TaxID=2614124 RepID=UPI001091A6B3|nr:TetR/AcrR family transcriptional regulator [Brevibacterium sp. S22]TGD29732.1 TetR/AcrR family transcriptional regulator [Brevibacterium sp. S22]
MTDNAVPDFFRRLWRLPEAPQQRGRKSTLDVETVVSTAVRLADGGGLEAATLPKVAVELNVTAMSLYRHIGSKHELLQLMIDAASRPTAPRPAGADWREGLRSWAGDLWTLYQERPWLPRVPIYRAPSGPNQVAWLERGLAELAHTGMSAKEKLSALTLLSGFVRQSALLQTELEEGREPGQAKSESERAYGEALAQVISSETFPHLAEALSSEAFRSGNTDDGEAGEDTDFSEGLEVILDGLATNVAVSRAGSRAAEEDDGDDR